MDGGSTTVDISQQQAPTASNGEAITSPSNEPSRSQPTVDEQFNT